MIEALEALGALHRCIRRMHCTQRFGWGVCNDATIAYLQITGLVDIGSVVAPSLVSAQP
jgi:hypothetical protein